MDAVVPAALFASSIVINYVMARGGENKNVESIRSTPCTDGEFRNTISTDLTIFQLQSEVQMLREIIDKLTDSQLLTKEMVSGKS